MSINDLGRSRKVYPFFRNPTVPPTVVDDLEITSVITSNFTAGFDQLVRVDPSGGPFTVTLPPINSKTGKTIIVKNVTTSTNVVTVDAAGSETIDGALTYSIDSAYETIMVFSDGSNWQIGYINAPQAGNAAGSSTQVQFNDGSGVFGASSGLTFNKTAQSLFVGGDATIGGGDLTLTGSTVNIVSNNASSTVNLFNTNATTVSIAGGATTGVTLGNAAGTITVPGNLTGSKNLAVNAGNITTTATTGNIFNENATTVNIAGGAATSLTMGNTNGTITVPGNLTGSKNLAVNAGNITTTATTGNIFNSAATSLNIGGAATAISIGSGTGNTTINNSLKLQEIKSSVDDSVAFSLPGSGNATIAGILRVNGNSIRGANGVTALTLSDSLVYVSGNLYVGDGTGTDSGKGDIIMQPASGFSADITTTSTTGNIFNSTATTVNIAGGATTAVTLGNATGTITVPGNLTGSKNLAVNAGNITTTATTANIFNTNATTINLGGATTAMSIGSGTGTTTVNNGLRVNGNATVDGTLNVAGGYGASGLSVDLNGNLQMNGSLTVDLSASLGSTNTSSITLFGVLRTPNAHSLNTSSTLLTSDYLVWSNSTGALNFTLESASIAGLGRNYIIKNNGAGQVNIVPATGQSINSLPINTSFALPSSGSVTVVCVNTSGTPNWITY